MLKLKWPLRKKTGETLTDAPGAAAGVEEATMPGDATGDVTGAPDAARVTEFLEMIKTAVVWLVVINILTVLSPLLWLPLKWAVAVGVLLTVSSVVVGGLAYLRARGMQRHFPE